MAGVEPGRALHCQGGGLTLSGTLRIGAARPSSLVDAPSPTIWNVPDLHTLLLGLVALQAGILLCRRVAVLGRLDIPASVVGGVLMSFVTMAVYALSGVEIVFATTLRDVLLLVFFVTIGLSAKLSALRAGGRPLAILCAVTVLLLVLQNVTGLLMARAFGAHPFMPAPPQELYGNCCSSLIPAGAATQLKLRGILNAGPELIVADLVEVFIQLRPRPGGGELLCARIPAGDFVAVSRGYESAIPTASSPLRGGIDQVVVRPEQTRPSPAHSPQRAEFETPPPGRPVAGRRDRAQHLPAGGHRRRTGLPRHRALTPAATGQSKRSCSPARGGCRNASAFGGGSGRSSPCLRAAVAKSAAIWSA